MGFHRIHAQTFTTENEVPTTDLLEVQPFEYSVSKPSASPVPSTEVEDASTR